MTFAFPKTNNGALTGVTMDGQKNEGMALRRVNILFEHIGSATSSGTVLSETCSAMASVFAGVPQVRMHLPILLHLPVILALSVQGRVYGIQF